MPRKTRSSAVAVAKVSERIGEYPAGSGTVLEKMDKMLEDKQRQTNIKKMEDFLARFGYKPRAGGTPKAGGKTVRQAPGAAKKKKRTVKSRQRLGSSAFV